MVKPKIKDLQQLIADLTIIIASDGKISSDEQRIFEQLIVDIREFAKKVDLFSEDKNISIVEESMLKVLWKKIYQKAEKIALEDDKITEDEAVLIERIKRTILNSN